MPASISELHAYLVADAQGHPLPSPQPIDLATEVVAYGARVRLAFQVQGDEPVHLPLLWVTGAGLEARRQAEFQGGEYVDEFQAPLAFFGWADVEAGSLGDPPLPLAQWRPAMTSPQRYQLAMPLIPVGTRPSWPFGTAPPPGLFPTVTSQLQVGSPSSPGGAAPVITDLTTTLGQETSLRLGQPWKFTITVQDGDDDALGACFAVVRGGRARLSWLISEGRKSAGVSSFCRLRIGGDAHDREGVWLGEGQDAATVWVQAFDSRGNWSAPVTFAYRLRFELPPLWGDDPTPGGPVLLGAGASVEDAPFDLHRVWARCSDPHAWVCARFTTQPNRVTELWTVAGPDRTHFYEGELGRGRAFDAILYTVPRDNTPIIGDKRAVTMPALAAE